MHNSVIICTFAQILLPSSMLLIILLTQLLTLKQVNWANYPYCPATKVRVSCTNDNLILSWTVVEKNIRGTVTKDQGAIWEDSAVELFCLLPDGKHYTNFEFNCLGYCLSDIQVGMPDKNRISRTAEELAKIRRKASLGRDSIGIIEGETQWKLKVEIPLRFILDSSCWDEKGKLRKGTTIQCNFYKCADHSKTPHYITWSEVKTARPNFHKPEYFQKLRIK